MKTKIPGLKSCLTAMLLAFAGLGLGESATAQPSNVGRAVSTLRFVDLESLAPVKPLSVRIDGHEVAGSVGVDGVVELDLPVGEHAIEVLAKGYRAMRARHGAVAPRSLPNTFHLVPETPRTSGVAEFAQGDGYRVFGWIRAVENHQAIQGASVLFESGEITLETTTTTDGQYVLSVPANAFQGLWRIRADAPQRWPRELSGQDAGDLPAQLCQSFLLLPTEDLRSASEPTASHLIVVLPNEATQSHATAAALQMLPNTICVGMGAPRGTAPDCSGFNEKCGSSFNACSQVDVVDMETYVKRVFRGELFGTVIWDDAQKECFKANAVAIRSYAAWRALGHQLGSQYDICNSDSCQCYFSGFSAFGPISTAASQETEGQVLLDSSDRIAFSEYGNWNDGCERGYLHCNSEPQYPNVSKIYDYAIDRDDADSGGHGRGMSQYGSHFRAKNGENYQQILTFYYQDYGWRLSSGGCTPEAAEVGGDIALVLPFRAGEQYRVTQGYCGSSHRGFQVDFGVPEGTAIVAVAPGTVVDMDNYIPGMDCRNENDPCGLDGRQQRGRFVILSHLGRQRTWYSHYFHLSSRLVQPGELVRGGDIIGLSGNTGWSTAAHLHFSVTNASLGGVRPVPTQGITGGQTALTQVPANLNTSISDFQLGNYYLAIGDAAFRFGDVVQVFNVNTVGLKVRSPFACSPVLPGKDKYDGDTGIILGLSRFCEGFNRWLILWNDGTFGWSAQNWLTNKTSLFPAVTRIWPPTLLFSPQSLLPAKAGKESDQSSASSASAQRVTLTGSGFSTGCTITLSDGTVTFPGVVPAYIAPNEIKFDFNISTQTKAWTARVVCGASESPPYPFYVNGSSDITTPPVPIGLNSDTSGWFLNNSILLDWTNPIDPSGIVKVWYKPGSTPTAANDGIAYDLPNNKPLLVFLPQSQGAQTIHLWLEDGAGNKNHNNRATLTLGVDPFPPAINISSPSSAQYFSTTQSTVTLAGGYTDNLSGIASITWDRNSIDGGVAHLAGSATSGTWSTDPIPLSVGNNLITVTAFDSAGNQSSVTIQVVYLDNSNSGAVRTTITPQSAIDAGAQWRVNGGTWHNSGDTENNVSVGTAYIDFKPVNGWNRPAVIPVSIFAGQTAFVNGSYSPAPVNQPPNVPGNASPPNGAVNITRAQPVFSWTAGDPDGPVETAFFLDTNPNPTVYAGFGAFSGSSYQIPSTLLAGTTYYWKVRLRDNQGLTTDSPVWSFTTEYAYADLVANGLALTGNVEPGAQVMLSVTVRNDGTFISPGAYVHFYLSRAPGAKEIRLTPNVPDVVPNLQPGQQQPVMFTATLNNLQAGQSFIDAWIDSGPPGPFNEQNFENNVQSIEIHYIDGKDPEVFDLALGSYGSFVRTGESRSIFYWARDNVGIRTVDFYYSTDAGVTWIVIQEGHVPTTPPAYGAIFPWAIPNNLPLGTNLLIWLIARDSSGNAGERMAGPYEVRDGSVPLVTVVFPNGGEVFDMGSTQQVRWTISTPNGIYDMSLWFEHDGITEFIANVNAYTNGVYPWIIRNNFSTTTGKIRIRVTDGNGNEATDTSDAYFVVRDPTAPPPPPWTTPTPITSTPSGDPGGRPRIVTDATGTAHLIYGVNHDGSAHTIKFRYKKRIGSNWTAPTAVSLDVQAVDSQVGSNYAVSDWRFAVDTQEYPHLVWDISFPTIPERNKADVFYSSFNGTIWSTPLNLSDGIRGSFNANSLTWSNRQSMPVAQANCASAVLNGKLYIIGGNFNRRVYEYTPGGNSWAQGMDAPAAITDGGAAAVNNSIYVVAPGPNNTLIYDPTGNSWTTAARVPTPRTGVAVAAVNGRIYAIGGLNSSKNEMFDPSTGNWTTKPDMPTARAWPGIAVVDNMIYVIGGRATDGSDLNTIELFDPASDTWGVRTRPFAAQWPTKEGAVAAVVNGRIYLMAGRNGNSYLTTVDEYDPASNSWIPMLPIQGARSYCGGGGIGTELFVAGGTEFNGEFPNTLSTVERATINSSLVGAASRSPMVAIDSSNRVHVAWLDGAVWAPDTNSVLGFSPTGSDNMFHRLKSGEQTLAQITTNGASSPAITSDRSNNVFLAFWTYPKTIGFMRWDGAAWSGQTVAATNGDAFINITADGQGRVHMAWNYYNGPSSQVLYSTFEGTSWSAFEVAVNMSSSGGIASYIGADSLGRPHVLWEDWGFPSKISYSTRLVDHWSAPLRLNLNSQLVASYSSDGTLSTVNDELHVVWNSSVNGNTEVMYNHAFVGGTNDVYAPSVSVIAPNAGEALTTGSSFDIRWSATDNTSVAGIDLHYSANGGSDWTLIASNEANDGTYSWVVPNFDTNAGQIRITARDAAGNFGTAFSGTFSTVDLTPPVIALVAPTNGAVLTGNGTTNVNWLASDNVAVTRIDLEYSLDDGNTWLEMASALANTGVYSWDVPNTPTTLLRIRVTARDAAGFAASATSSQPLTIVHGNTPPIAPHSPFPLNGASNVPISSVTLLWSSWDADGDPLTYEVRLGTNGNLPVVYSGATASLNLATVRARTMYSWQVAVSDGMATNTGPFWTFTTGPVPQPLFTQVSRLGDGTIQLELGGLFEESYRLETSSNLVHWTTLTSFTATGPSAVILDSTATNFNQRFYRVVIP